jgi:hypothetical protein
MAFTLFERRGEKLRHPDNPYFVINKTVPLVNPLLDTLGKEGRRVPNTMLDDVIKETKPLEPGYMRVTSDRSVDTTGYITYIAGISHSPEDSVGLIDDIGHRQLEVIEQMEPQIRNEIFQALQGERATLRAILNLDMFQKSVIEELREYQEQSPLSQVIRNAGFRALDELYAHPNNLPDWRSIKIPLNRALVLYDGSPRMTYIPTSTNGYLQSVDHYFFIPNIWNIRITDRQYSDEFRRYPELAKYNGQSIGEILSAITPQKYREDSQIQYNASTLSGFMALLGKSGHIIPRQIAEWVRNDDARLREIRQEQDRAASLQDWYLSHS